MKLWKKNIIMLLIAGAIAVIPLLINKGAEFGGADGKAKDAITQIKPGYKPWADSLFQPPSTEVESLLFALQAALGAGFLGFAFGRLSVKNKENNK
ncbi:energy-coupling factor ABC transporter substrate-binding protein [Clostridium cylindrosporum]|uniref:Cobalt transport protein CbiN n=1 Tax=Clostridium cylindrosporum DSM 605 TaxID=1121307 RepID=A0A0J8DC03_CLOCY|nr:energy-coupling factor ABC transporter substrate-binding protein [Clostridium cylindrosporum]KMT21829.1 cobalt transport protein CbiN [Clostridium cylindrosporum DSM 605]